VFTEPLSRNGRICGAFLTAHFRRSGVMSQYSGYVTVKVGLSNWKPLSLTRTSELDQFFGTI
jgi:hypothetical protein